MKPLLLAVLCLTVLGSATASAISLDFVNVGDVGNPNDTSGYGAVSYDYSIGKTEVTLLQYTAFLSAVGATDTYNLYTTNMAIDLNIAGIARSGTSGSYTYSVIGDGQRPVTYVSWFDAARFTNWLHNGQPTGLQTAATTEDGAYTLSGANSGVGFSKILSAQYWIPSENEWYKAAYYDPSLSGTGGYWLYPTRSNSDPGNVVGSGTNQANYQFWNGSDYVYSVTQSSSYSSTQNYLTAVGVFTNSASAYGTYDQGGNVYELNDAVLFGSVRGLRGGSWGYGGAGGLQSSGGIIAGPADEFSGVGFRVASVPEPSTWAMLAAGAGSLIAFRRRSRG